MKIKIFTTGGTIDKIYFDAKSQFQIGEPQIPAVLHEANVTIQCDLIPLMRKDSLDLTNEDRQIIHAAIAAEPCDRIVVTHGTDTMTKTACALADIPDKTIVFTGSMQPARFRTTDAVYNIASALTAVQLLPAGAYIAMNGRVFEADKVRKNVEAHRFELVEWRI